MTLSEKQRHFAALVANLITWGAAHGYGVTFGEAFRTVEQAKLNAASGAGILNSLHTIRLAIDLNLFVGGVFQTATAAYRPLGVYWESLDPLCRWGGRFAGRPDGNHFSLSHNGRQ